MLYDKHTNLQLRLYDQQAQGRIKCVYVSVYKRHVHVLLKDVSAMRWLRQVHWDRLGANTSICQRFVVWP